MAIQTFPVYQLHLERTFMNSNAYSVAGFRARMNCYAHSFFPLPLLCGTILLQTKLLHLTLPLEEMFISNSHINIVLRM